MSATAPKSTPKGGRTKQRQTDVNPNLDQPEGRQLQPYFDETVAGDAIQPVQNGPANANVTQKTPRKKQNQATPGKQKSRQQGLKPPARPAELGYHSESGTAHYMYGSRNRSASAAAGVPYPNGNTQHAPMSQPILPSNGHDHINGLSATPAKQVYAGPNFLASPAASSLPMPKAFAKNMTRNGTSPDSKTAPANGERAQSTPLKQQGSFSPSAGREGSPLDFLFNADKAERLRQPGEGTSPLSVRPQTAASGSGSLRPTKLHDVRSRSHGASPSRKDVLLQEMDGIGVEPDSPDSDAAPATPATTSYKQQMAALRSRSESIPDQSPPPSRDPSLQSQTDALKKMLFASQQRPFPGPTPYPHQSPSHNRKAMSIDIGNNHGYPQYGSLSPLHSPTAHMNSHMPSQQPRSMASRQVSTEPQKSYPGQAPAPSASNPDIKTMEDNLRNFLKIGS